MIKTHQKISIAILVAIMLVSFVIISMPSLSAEEYGYDVRDNLFPNDLFYLGYNLYNFRSVQFYKVGNGNMSYKIIDDGLHIWAESNSDNLYQSYLDLQKIEVKKNTKYVIAVRIDGYQNTGAIRVASNGDGANRNNLVTVRAKPYTYQYYEFTTLDDTEYLQLYFYPKYEQSGSGNSDFRNIMIYEVNDDNGYKSYEPYGGWYKFGVENAVTQQGQYILNCYKSTITSNGITLEYADIPIGNTRTPYYVTLIDNAEDVEIGYNEYAYRIVVYYKNKGASEDSLPLQADLSIQKSYLNNSAESYTDDYIEILSKDKDYRYVFTPTFPSTVDVSTISISITTLSPNNTLDKLVFYGSFELFDKGLQEAFYQKGYVKGEQTSLSIIGIFGSSLNAIGDFFMTFLNYEILGISLLEVLAGIFIVMILLWVISFLR